MGTSERRYREKERRKNDILNVAEQIFYENGFAATTMDEIAEKTELAKGTLYLYFPNKEALHNAIVLRGMDVLLDRFAGAVEKQQSGLSKIRAIGDAYYEFVVEHQTYAMIMSSSTSRELSEASPEIVAARLSKDAELFGIMKEAIETGQRDGSINSDLDAHKTAFLVALLTQNYMSAVLQNVAQIERGFSMDLHEASQLYFDFVQRALTV